MKRKLISIIILQLRSHSIIAIAIVIVIVIAIAIAIVSAIAIHAQESLSKTALYRSNVPYRTGNVTKRNETKDGDRSVVA